MIQAKHKNKNVYIHRLINDEGLALVSFTKNKISVFSVKISELKSLKVVNK